MSLDAIYGDREFWLIQNHSGKEDPSRRVIARACRVAGFDEAERPELDQFGDVVGANHWSSSEVRGFGSWSWAWPALTTSEVQNPPRSSGTRTRSALQGSLVGVLPSFDGMRQDTSYDLKGAVVAGSGTSDFNLPVGWPGIVLSGTAQDEQLDLFFPAGGAPLISSVAGQRPDTSSIVSDTDARGRVDYERQGRLHDVLEVVYDAGPAPNPGEGRDALALRFGSTIHDAPPDSADPLGLVTCVSDSGLGVPGVRYLMSQSLLGNLGAAILDPDVNGGPFEAGPANTPRATGRDGDGRNIAPLMLSTSALFATPGGVGGILGLHGGPLDFDMEVPALSRATGLVAGANSQGDIYERCRIAWDPDAGPLGRWVVEAPVSFTIEEQTSGGTTTGLPPQGTTTRPIPLPGAGGGPPPPPGGGGGGGPDFPGGAPLGGRPRRPPAGNGGIEPPPTGPWPQPFQVVDDILRQGEIDNARLAKAAKDRQKEFEEEIKQQERERAAREDLELPVGGLGKVSPFVGGGAVAGPAGVQPGFAVGAGGGIGSEQIIGFPTGDAGSTNQPAQPIPTIGRGPEWTAYPTSTRCVRVPGLVVRANPTATGQPSIGGWPGRLPDSLRQRYAESPDVAVLVGYGQGDGTLDGWTNKQTGSQPARGNGGICVLPSDLSLADAAAGNTSPGGYRATVCLPTGGASGGTGGCLGFGTPDNTTGYVTSGTTMEQTTNGLKLAPVDSSGTDATARWSFTTASVMRFDGGASLLMEDSASNTSTTISQSTDGILLFTGDVQISGKLTVTEVVDPYGYLYDAVGARPTELDGSNAGTWVDTSGNLYYWDTATDILLAAGGGGSGGGHAVIDSGTTTAPVVTAWDHQTSGTPASGFGLTLQLVADNDVNAATLLGYQVAHWTDPTNGSEDSDWEFYGKNAGNNLMWMQWDGSLGEILTRKYHANGATTDYVMHFIAHTDDDLIPSSGFGGRHAYSIQHAASNQKVAADMRWYWDGTVANDSTIEWLCLDAGAGASMLKLVGADRKVLLPQGILEFADQGTLGTPATGYARIGFDKTADSLRPRFVDDAGTETSMALLSDVSGGDHTVEDAGTTTSIEVVNLSRTTTGTAGTGLGGFMAFDLENAAGTQHEAIRLDWAWTTATAASEEARATVQAVISGSLQDILYVGKTSKGPWDYGLDVTGSLWAGYSDSATSTTLELVEFQANTSGTAAAGFGGRLALKAENAVGTNFEAARLEWVWTSAASTSEDADLVLSNSVGGSLTELLRLDADGDGAGGTDATILFSQGRYDLAQQTSPGTPPTGRVRLSSYDGQRRSLDVMDEDGKDGSIPAVVRAEAAANETSSSTETDIHTETVIFNRTNDWAQVTFYGRIVANPETGAYRLYVNGTAVATVTANATATHIHGTMNVQRNGTTSKVWGTWVTHTSSTGTPTLFHYINNAFGDISSSSGIVLKCTGQWTTSPGSAPTIRSDAFNVVFMGGNGT